MAEKRKRYTEEFKRPAVQLLENTGKSGSEIEDYLGIGRGQICRWRQQLSQENGTIHPFPGTEKPRNEELSKVKRELAIAREERDILRKAVAIYSRVKR